MSEQDWEAVAQVRVIAPKTKTMRTILIALACMTLVGGLLTIVSLAFGGHTRGASRGLAYGATLFALGILLLPGMWLWFANVRLLIGRGAVGYRNIFGRSRFWSRGEIDRVVDMAINYGRSSQPQRGFYLFGLDGKRLLALSSRAWDADDLRAFIDATGVQVEYRDAPVPAKAVRREFPNAFGWGAEHVMTATLITMAGAIVLAIGGYMLVSGLFHS
jgi:hypothetical protein